MASVRFPVPGFPKKLRLEDGSIAEIDFLGEKDSPRELQRFINSLIDEGAFIVRERKRTLKEEIGWVKERLAARKKKDGYLLVARVDGKIAGTSDARRGRDKERNNISLGIALAKGCRGIGLGEALLGLNIAIARKMKPKNIFLSVFAANARAIGLYKKLGFRKFAVFPQWILHDGKYIDSILMKLER